MFVGLAFLLVLVAVASVEFEGANILTLIVLGAAAVLFIAGFVLVGLGPRADKQDKDGPAANRPSDAAKTP